MDLTTFAVVAACVAVAAFVQGTTGVGFALIVAPIVGLVPQRFCRYACSC